MEYNTKEIAELLDSRGNGSDLCFGGCCRLLSTASWMRAKFHSLATQGCALNNLVLKQLFFE